MASSRASLRSVVGCVAFGVLAVGVSKPASAQETVDPSPNVADATHSAQSMGLASPDTADRRIKTEQNRKIFLPLYSSFVALQVLDLQSTSLAIRAGGHEGNPLIAALSETGPRFALKAAGTATIIYVTERMRRQHRRAAIMTMIALDSAYAMVVAHNYALAHP